MRRRVCNRLRHVIAHHADRIEARIDLRLVADSLKFFLHAVQVSLALDLVHGLHELPLELGRHPPHPPYRLADSAHHPRQILWRNHRQSDDADDDHLADVKIEHGSPNRTTNCDNSRPPRRPSGRTLPLRAFQLTL